MGKSGCGCGKRSAELAKVTIYPEVGEFVDSRGVPKARF
jgi:hypothetical protein